MDYKKQSNETDFEYKIRLCNAKLNKEIDLDWSEIVELLELDIHPDSLRKMAYGYLEVSDYYQNKKETESINDGYTKCLIMNDLHIPYQRDDLLTEIAKHKNVDYIIFGGDIIDCESCSSFDVFDRPSIEEELVQVHGFLCKVNEIIDPNKTKMIAIRGNHEARYTKEISRMQQKQLQKMLNPNILSMLETGFTYYEKTKDITYKKIDNFQYIDHWNARLFNNLIVAHPTDFSGIDGKMCEKVSEHFLNKHIAEPDDVVIFGHTHKHSAMKVNRRQGLYVIENFCLCKPMDYADTGKLGYNPQNYGYTYLKFKEGQKININDISIIHLQ